MSVKNSEELWLLNNSSTDNFDVPMQTELCGKIFTQRDEFFRSLLFLTNTSTQLIGKLCMSSSKNRKRKHMRAK